MSDQPAGPSKRFMLILLAVSLALIVAGVVRCSYELTSVEGGRTSAGELSESD